MSVRAAIAAIVSKAMYDDIAPSVVADDILALIKPSYMCGACGKVHLCRNCWPRLTPINPDELTP